MLLTRSFYIENVLLILSLLFLFDCSRNGSIDPTETPTEVITDSIVFAVIGDFGEYGDPEIEVANMIKSWNPDFIITTGDNNYNEGDSSTIIENISNCYSDYIYNFDAPEKYRCKGKATAEKINRFFPSPGNHDENYPNGLTPYLDYFTLPGNELYYQFTWGPVHFYSLNSLTSDVKEQQLWLEDQLKSDSSAFQIVYFHHSPYSSGPHGNNEYMQWDFKGLGIDAVVTGHDHLYARIVKKDEEGVYYFENGAGGKTRHSCVEHALDSTRFSVFCFDQDYGAMRIKCNPDKMILEFFAIGDTTLSIDKVEINRLK